MNHRNRDILRILPLDQVTSPQDLRGAVEQMDPDPAEVEGPEKVFRLNNAFHAEERNGAIGLLRQCELRAEAQQMDILLFERFRKATGLDRPPGIGDVSEELLDDMVDKLWVLRSELGNDVAVWAILWLISQPQKGRLNGLLKSYNACRSLSASEILNFLAEEKLRQEIDEIYD